MGELLILEDGLIVEVTGVYGELVEAMIVEGSPVQARDKIVQRATVISVRGTGRIHRQCGIENERYRLAYTVDENLRLLAELENCPSRPAPLWIMPTQC